MDIKNVQQGNLGAVYQNSSKQGEAAENEFFAGMILEGIVTEVGEKVSMELAGKSYSFPKEFVPEAYKGQVRHYEILEAGENGISLRELKDENKQQKTANLPVQVECVQAIAEQEDREETDNFSEDAKAVADHMSAADYCDLAAEGFTLEKFNLERLARALERIRAGREQKEAAIEGANEKKQKDRENIRRAAVHLAGGTPLAEHLADLLVQADIPVTKEKIGELSDALKLGTDILQKGLTDAAKAYLIGNHREPSIAQLYRAVYSGSGSDRRRPLEDKVWEELRTSTQTALSQAGMDVGEEELKSARWLLEHDLPVTAENVLYKGELDGLDKSVDVQALVEKVFLQIKGGGAAGETLLVQEPQELFARAEAERVCQEFAQIAPETMDAAAAGYGEGNEGAQSWSLAFLKRLQKELDGVPDERALQNVTARRQLEEVRLRLTTEAGVKLMKLGIHPDTDSLETIVQGLKKIENEYYGRLYLETSGEAGNEDAVALLRETSESVERVKQSPMQLLGVTFVSRRLETIQSLGERGEHLANQLTQANERYEALMTKPRRDMGDRVQTAFRNVDELLRGMQLDTTEANRRAVHMITYSHTELTQENLMAMKQYDALVQSLLTDMNPAACARMIQKGINPLSMPLEQLSDTLRELKEQEGASTEEKFSNYLVKLDRRKELSEAERESYIGIYRLLHQVTKSDGAAVGMLVASGRELTLENLLSAVRTGKRGGIDASVDDKAGAVQEVNTKGKSISEQISAAFGFAMNTAQTVLDKLSPEAVAQAGGPEQMLKEKLEQLAETMRQADVREENTLFGQESTKDLTQLLGSSEAEQAFLNAYGQEITAASVRAAREFLSAGSVHTSLKRLARQYGVSEDIRQPDISSMQNAENMRQAVEKWSDSADKVIGTLFEQAPLTGEDSTKLLIMRGAIRMAVPLAQRECYEIPLRAQSGYIKLNLTVQHVQAQKGNVRISFRGEDKDLNVELKMEGKRLDCFIMTDSETELSGMKEKEAWIQKSLKEQGFEITQWNYGLRTRSAGQGLVSGKPKGAAAQQGQPEATRTDDMYLAAKTIIQAVDNGQPS